MNIFKKINDFFYQRVPVKKGDILVCAKWGGEWSKLEIVNVHSNGRNFKFKFLIVNGKKSLSGDLNEMDNSWLKGNDTYVHEQNYKGSN